MIARPLAWLAALCAATACSSGPPPPAPLDTRNDTCQSCRMTVSDARFAAQLAAAGEEPRFFDDIGCLATYLKDHPDAGRRAVAYVADHRTKAWVRAGLAVYTRVPGIETPMSSHLVAHADAASRDRDAEAAGGAGMSAADVFGPAGPPGGKDSAPL